MSETEFSSERRYDVLETDDGSLMLVLTARQSPARNAVLVYDGGSDAVLLRNAESTVHLSEIAETVRGRLAAEDGAKLLVTEMDGDAPGQTYTARITLVDPPATGS